MRVSMLMQAPPVTCAPRTSVREVCQLMDEHRVGAVVVVHDGTVAGIVTDRDVALRVVGHDLSGDVPVERVMTRNVARVPIGADVAEAEATMRERQVRRLPVVDVHGRLHGVIALDDVVRHIGRQADEVTDLLVRQAKARS